MTGINMKINLNIKERLSILQMLPDSGSLSEMIDIMEIIKKVRVEQLEKDEIQYKETNGLISWDISRDKGKDIDFSHEEISILKASVRNLDSNKKITPTNLDVCIKINSL